MRKALFLFICAALFCGAGAQVLNPEQQLVTESIADLRDNILPFWEKYAPDPRGGFYGTLLNDGTAVPDAPKGEVLNARILWTFSRAYLLFGQESYRQLADRAQTYFLNHFIDRREGGVYWSLHADGTPENREKQTYGMAYAIYGLAEHYRATGNAESLKEAIALYQTLEQYAFDPQYGGYIESFTSDWKTPERYGYDGKGIAAKTMNTHLHVLEAYTLLYQVWRDAGLEKQLRGVIAIFLEKIIDRQRGHQRLFLTREWENLEEIDSYGHDMELSWLLYEAAELLHDQPLTEEIRRVALHLVDSQLKEGYNADGSLLYERDKGVVKGGLDWWPQAESVVALYNAWQLSGDHHYLDAAIKSWQWIKEHLIDRENGEWFRGILPNGSPDIDRPKADLWKCPYHNSRMGFELYSRIRNTPVKQYGQLAVKGAQLVDEKGEPLILRGVSLGWHNWWSGYYNANAIRQITNDWRSTLVRAAIGIEPGDGFIDNPELAMQCLTQVVNAAIAQGVYVIIDWHSHGLRLEEAKGFFREVAQRYGSYPNVIYELFNEPVNQSWEEVKAYSIELIELIREIDPDNLILVGSPHWCQDVHLAADDPIEGHDNLMYVMHFYAATHKKGLRDRTDYALSKGLPIFVSECAGMEASGDGPIDLAEWNAYVDWMNHHKLSWAAWSLSGKDESCSMLPVGTNPAADWKEEQLKEWAKIVRARLRKEHP